VGLHSYDNFKLVEIQNMNIQIEIIKGFVFGIDYMEGVSHSDFENGYIEFDLLRISLGLVFIHIPFNVRDTQ